MCPSNPDPYSYSSPLVNECSNCIASHLLHCRSHDSTTWPNSIRVVHECVGTFQESHKWTMYELLLTWFLQALHTIFVISDQTNGVIIITVMRVPPSAGTLASLLGSNEDSGMLTTCNWVVFGSSGVSSGHYVAGGNHDFISCIATMLIETWEVDSLVIALVRHEWTLLFSCCRRMGRVI